MERFVCVHAHFYQPPRENAWLEAIEVQDSAYPFHDWNARITAECYGPNGTSRILDDKGRITHIVNNYARISFNFGPTLLAWLETEAPDVYQAILDADLESQELFGGHGSAMAQAHNHMILPLANRRDKFTQIYWGIRDFVSRFKRQPQGMWLPEAAVDLESLDIMAQLGIEFTVLSPHQARRVRKIGRSSWLDISGGRIDPTMPYQVQLPSGRSIVVFFYDGPIAQSVAFEGLLSSGEHFAERLMSGFDDARTWPQILHIATDGESYGHHHRHGDMALAYALHQIEQDEDVELINYSAYLAHFTPTHEAEIFENSSWSCVHGVERWRANCGCNSGGNAGWNQEWRISLREALDWLRDELLQSYERQASELLVDPWKARDEYIEVVLDRSPENVDRFLKAHARSELSASERVTVLKLLELQRHTMLMYTSCGWFFDEISGIETVQVIQYAARAVQLAQDVFGNSIEERFLERLEHARSNIPEHKNARSIYEKLVRPARVDLGTVGAHYALSALFEEYESEADIFCYRTDLQHRDYFTSGRSSLMLGRVLVTSNITEESIDLCFGAAHFGDHNLSAGVTTYPDDETYAEIVSALSEPFIRADFPGLIRAIDARFGAPNYSLRSLFRDEQRKIIDLILTSTVEDADAAYRHVFEDHASLMHFLTDLSVPLPRVFQATAEFVVNSDLRRELGSDKPALDYIHAKLDEVRMWNIRIDHAGLGYELSRTIDRKAMTLAENPECDELLHDLVELTGMTEELPFEVNLWQAQNVYYDLLQSVFPDGVPEVSAHTPEAEFDESDRSEEPTWLEQFWTLGHLLNMRVG